MAERRGADRAWPDQWRFDSSPVLQQLHGVMEALLPGDPDQYRQRAISCANSAIACTSPAASQKFADLALVWLMLAVQLEEQKALRSPTPE